MAVVISDFEVLPDTKPAEQKKAGGESDGEAMKPNDVEVEQMLERLYERNERVRAH